MSTHTKTIIFVIGFLLGIVCGEVSSFASEVAVGIFLLAFIQGGIYFLGKVSERKRKAMSDTFSITHSFSFPLMTLLFSLGLCLGIIRAQLVEEKTNFVCESVCSFDAQIISSPEIKNTYQTFKVHSLTTNNQTNDILVRVPLYPKYRIGETINLSGKVTTPNIIFPHTNTKNNTKGFDYASYLRTKNIGSEITLPSVIVVDQEAHNLTGILGRWKEDLVARIDIYVAQPASSLASGMLFGASGMSEELLQTFRTAGLSHIIVLSGFNIVIVIAAILFILTFLPLILRIILASISVIIFVMMVGASPSVIRATLMAFIALLAMFIGRPYVAKQALILSLFAIVLYEPYALLHDVSLHLSFLATMGLVYMSNPIESFFKKYFVRITSPSLRELLITTLSAYFATLPYVMYTFGTVSVYALIANVLVVPFVPFAMLVSFFVVVSSYFSITLSSIVGFLDTTLINSMIGMARIIESLPFSMFTLTVSFLGMCSMYFFIFIGMQYASLQKGDETKSTIENGNLTDIISY